MRRIDEKGKNYLRAKSLNTALASLIEAFNELPVYIVDGKTSEVIKKIAPCVKKHINDQEFPAQELQEEINGLREAIEKRSPNGTSFFRKKIDDLLSQWVDKSAAIMVGS